MKGTLICWEKLNSQILWFKYFICMFEAKAKSLKIENLIITFLLVQFSKYFQQFESPFLSSSNRCVYSICILFCLILCYQLIYFQIIFKGFANLKISTVDCLIEQRLIGPK